ncbi:MAG: ABC transporter permease [Dehalococcoidia bacterium]
MASAPGPAAQGNIFDLGYRHYEGERRGRRHAIAVLYLESLRAAFGLGRSAAAKVAPAVLIFVAAVPALIQLIVSALFPGEAEVFTHDDYYGVIALILGLYCAAVAPDLAGRDQRNRALTLYFSRAIKRVDYAFAKLAAMTTAMLLITLGPQALLLIANGLVAEDFGAYLRDSWDLVLPIVGTALLGSALIASIGVAISAQTPRRAFATVGVVVAFIIPLAVAGILVNEIDTDATHYGVFLSPLDLIAGVSSWAFRAEFPRGSTIDNAGFSGWAYFGASLAIAFVASLLVVRRYRSIRA